MTTTTSTCTMKSSAIAASVQCVPLTARWIVLSQSNMQDTRPVQPSCTWLMIMPAAHIATVVSHGMSDCMLDFRQTKYKLQGGTILCGRAVSSIALGGTTASGLSHDAFLLTSVASQLQLHHATESTSVCAAVLEPSVERLTDAGEHVTWLRPFRKTSGAQTATTEMTMISRPLPVQSTHSGQQCC